LFWFFSHRNIVVVKMKQNGPVENAKLYFSGGPKTFLTGVVAQLDTALKVAPMEVSERGVYAAAAGLVTLLPPEGGVPGNAKLRPGAVTPPFSIDRRWRPCETGRTWMPT
jgi:hypothetical protein